MVIGGILSLGHLGRIRLLREWARERCRRRTDDMSIATALSGIALFLGVSGGQAPVPAAGWWSAAREVTPLSCPVHDRRYGLRALCGVTVYLDIAHSAQVREFRNAIATGLARGEVGPSAPPVEAIEVVELGEGRAAVILRTSKRTKAAALVRWAEGLVPPQARDAVP